MLRALHFEFKLHSKENWHIRSKPDLEPIGEIYRRQISRVMVFEPLPHIYLTADQLIEIGTFIREHRNDDAKPIRPLKEPRQFFTEPVA